jgi:hypothetical protein
LTAWLSLRPGFGLDSGIEALASIIVIWRLTGSQLANPAAERREQKSGRALAAGDHAETSIPGLVLTAGAGLSVRNLHMTPAAPIPARLANSI